MADIDLEPRFAHTVGPTVCAYSANGSHLITGGGDSVVRVFDASPDKRDGESNVIDQHSETVRCIAVHKGNFATAGDDGVVAVFRGENASFEKLLVRSAVPVRCLAYNHTGTKMAIAADEEIIRVVLIQDISKVVTLRGHTKAARSVAFDPLGGYLISSGCDGDVRIWDVEPTEGESRCVQTLSSITKAILPDSMLRLTVAWKPDGSAFAFPGKNGVIHIYSRTIWKEAYTLANGHIDDVITIAWSPNGHYLASTGVDNQLIIWSTSKRSIVRRYYTAVQCTGVAWHPMSNELTFADADGMFTIWEDVIPLDQGFEHPAQNLLRISNKELESLFEDEEDDMGHEEPIARRTTNEAREEMAEDDMDMASETDDFVVDDDGAGYAETSITRERHLHAPVVSRERALHITTVPRFQPGSTPFKDTSGGHSVVPREGARRYLAFNLVGVIYTIFQGTHSIINVEFHDQSQHRNFHFTDYLNYTMGSLGEKGAVFAVESSNGQKKQIEVEEDDDDEESEEDDVIERKKPKDSLSMLHYRPLSNWTNNSEWTVQLPKGENVLSVAINNVSVIAVTSANYVRIFSLAGIQRHIFRMDGVVTAAGAADLAFFVYSVGPCLKDQCNLEFLLMNTDTCEILQKDKVPLSKDSKLIWAGFSETTQPAIYDSKSIMCVLHRQRRPGQAAWVPVFDGEAIADAREKTERYWPVGLLRDRIMCLILRGNNEYPFFPRPAVSDIELQMPTLENHTDSGKLEEQYLRTHIMTLHERDEAEATGTEDEYFREFSKADMDMDKALLQLIQLACKADKVQRALDLASALHSSRSVDAAIKIASFHHITNLAERFTRIKELKFMGERDTLLRSVSLAESQASRPRIYESSQQSLSSDLAFVDRVQPTRLRKRSSIDEPMDEDDYEEDNVLPTSKRTRPDNPFRVS
ncbi:hypothetical protein EC973_007232 [Apophysomyces ossiformis]|uniref:Minichromosome loss protein Mcl1 middle region domain-containing protein n=1 Tax=Apophysomyces ossiformis TaxID=679940 RepID=A0A8H7BUZ0_9FUNG|nr:hypothetical protein EC973_007232 [Apophysomyces ossiformis]